MKQKAQLKATSCSANEVVADDEYTGVGGARSYCSFGKLSRFFSDIEAKVFGVTDFCVEHVDLETGIF